MISSDNVFSAPARVASCLARFGLEMAEVWSIKSSHRIRAAFEPAGTEFTDIWLLGLPRAPLPRSSGLNMRTHTASIPFSYFAFMVQTLPGQRDSCNMKTT